MPQQKFMDVEMPDGTVVEDVPVGTPKGVILQKYMASKAPSRQQSPGPMPSVYNAVPGQQQAVMDAPQPGIAGMLNRAEGKLENFVGGAPNSGGARDYLLSPERGALHMAQGAAEGRPGRVVKGALEAATVPSMFMGPESAGAGKLGKALDVASDLPTATGRARLATGDVIKVLGKVSQDAGLGELKANTAREAMGNLAQGFRSRASSAYQSVDKAVGGELQPVLDKIDDMRMAIKKAAAIDPEAASRMQQQLIDLMTRKGQLIKQAMANGVQDAEKAIAVADRDWSQFRNIERIAKNIKTAAGEVREGGLINPKKFATAVDNTLNSGRMVRALGEQGASAMKTVATDSLARERAIETLKQVLKAGAYATGGYLGIRKLTE